jgi:hypothetical protein
MKNPSKPVSSEGYDIAYSGMKTDPPNSRFFCWAGSAFFFNLFMKKPAAKWAGLIRNPLR